MRKKKEEGVEIAFIKDSYGKWAFPKGHLEKGENKDEAAVREVQEEMGCKRVKVLKYLGKIQYFFKDAHGRDGEKKELIKKEVHYHLMEIPKNEKCSPQRSEGIEEITWINPPLALELSEYKNNIPIIKKALKEIKNFSG